MWTVCDDCHGLGHNNRHRCAYCEGHGWVWAPCIDCNDTGQVMEAAGVDFEEWGPCLTCGGGLAKPNNRTQRQENPK